MVILKIDRALYEVDDETKTYKYYGRNPDWQKLSKTENCHLYSNLTTVTEKEKVVVD
jgi:hypothetical protein